MQRRHRRAHARIWSVLAFLLPALLLVALVIRQVGPAEAPAVKLEAVAESGADTQ